MKSLYKLIHNEAFDYYRCMACKPKLEWCGWKEGKEERYLINMEMHIVKEHMDKLEEVDSEMRREVLARKKANHGVEDPVRWEEYYRTNCKLVRPT